MANGVKLATAYIDITGDTSSVTQSVKDALDQSVKDAEPAGKKFGQKMSAGIEKGMDVFRDLGSKLSDDLSKGLDASKTGQQVGRDLQKAIEGADMGSVGKKLSTAIANATQGISTGQKIGQEIKTGADSALKDLGKGALDEFKQGARQWGQQVGNELRSGDVQGALNDIGNTAHNVTDIIGNIGSKFGANVEGIRNVGSQIDNTLGQIGTKAQAVTDDVTKIAGAIKQIHEGDAAGKVRGVVDAVDALAGGIKDLTGKDITPFVQNVQNLAGTVESLRGVAGSAKEIAAAFGVAPNPGWLQLLPLFFVGAVPDVKPTGDQAVIDKINEIRAKKGLPPLKPGQQIPGMPGHQVPGGHAPTGLTPGGAPSMTPGSPATGQPPELAPGVTIPGMGVAPSAYSTGATAGPGTQNVKLASWDQIDAVATGQFGLTVGSTFRSPSGPTIAGVPAAQSYHASGRAHDYNGTPEQRLAFANYMAANYGSQLKELIYEAPGFNSTIKDGKIVGPFGSYYTLGQAGYHGDHVHIAFKTGGALGGSGPVPIIAHGGEHVLTAADVTSMGGQGAVYAWRKALHYQGGGDVGGTPDWLKEAAGKAGMSPQDYLTAMAHLPPGGATPPGPAADMQANIWQQATGGTGKPGEFNPADIVELARTAGFLPSGAGSKAVAGTSFVAGILNIGNELVDTGIDVAAAAGKTAIQMAIAAASGAAQAGGSSGFSPGAGGAGGAIAAGGAVGQTLADWGIDLLANEAKRGVSYGFQVAAIGADSLIDQMFGMFGGPPRWLGYDYTQFLPSLNFGGLAVTTTEKAMQMAQAGIEQGIKQGQTPPQPGGPVAPQQMPGAQPVGPPVPKFGTPPPQLAPPAGVPGKQQMAPPPGDADIPPPPGAELPPAPGAPPQPTQGPAPAGAPPPGAPPPAPPPPPAPAPPSPPPEGINPLQLLFGFDEGGWWPPNTRGINTTGRPELVLSPQQLDTMKIGPMGNRYGGKGDTFHIYAMDADEVGREIDKRRRLAMMQYSGRP